MTVPGSVSALLASIETFAALSVGQWLKIAGAEKGDLISSACPKKLLNLDERRVALELGTFVGYTTARLVGQGAFVVTMEQDPIHVVVSQ